MNSWSIGDSCNPEPQGQKTQIFKVLRSEANLREMIFMTSMGIIWHYLLQKSTTNLIMHDST